MNMYMNSMIVVGGRTGSEVATEVVGLRGRIKELEGLGEIREAKYNQAYARKDWYKAKSQELENKIEDMKAEISNERANDAIERQNREAEKYNLENRYEEAKERAEMLGEELGKLKISHKEEKDRLQETYHSQSEIDNGRIVKSEMRVADLEMEREG